MMRLLLRLLVAGTMLLALLRLGLTDRQWVCLVRLRILRRQGYYGLGFRLCVDNLAHYGRLA